MLGKKCEVYGTATVSQKGQIVIPASARKELKIKAGDNFIFLGHGQVLHLIKANELDSLIEKMNQKFIKETRSIKNKLKQKK